MSGREYVPDRITSGLVQRPECEEIGRRSRRVDRMHYSYETAAVHQPAISVMNESSRPRPQSGGTVNGAVSV